ncbi:MAG TPA: hypothetical protein IAC25_02430 [Candidatus Enterenecus stercoripullorum]|nr:hypothetical protein [Candidatus Enterenecus stercoripullorum]
MPTDHVDTGRLDERVKVLEFAEQSPDAWAWRQARLTWAKVELSTRHNVWSVHGIGATGVTMTMRKQALRLGNALEWNGRHCFITAIEPMGRNHIEVSAALVTIAQCEDKVAGVTFPASVTEKYMGHDQLEPYATNVLRHVLVTPKAIQLRPGQLVEVDGMAWPVTLAHTLDLWHNEYEIERTVDL